MTSLSHNALIELALDLTQSLNSTDRFDRLLDTIRKTIHCDAIALLLFQDSLLKPLAMQGLSKETLGRRFIVSEHPRFERICQSESPTRFSSDCSLPDPYDGLLLDSEDDLPVHACMGLPLHANNQLIGVLTLDSLSPGIFDHIPDRVLAIISAMASATLNTAIHLEQLEHQAQHNKNVVAELTQEAWQKDGGEIIGQSAVITALKSDIQVAASSDLTILITGETGVGKELVARTLHQASQRYHAPLVYVNCAALPENLIESELFGHVKGAFTGALKNRAGKFNLADGGTLFLDEIGELPLLAQSKLLRALQNQEIQPVGQDHIQKVNVRVITATNRDLNLEVQAGRFRADLFHRLSVYPIDVPPLRDRIGDIPLLAGFFVELARRKFAVSQFKISPEVMASLCQYAWPGNVRELEHVINRAALKARARHPQRPIITLQPEDCTDLPTDLSVQSQELIMPNDLEVNITSGLSLKEATEQFQRQTILNTLVKHQGNIAATARALFTDRANLTRLIKRLGIKINKQISL